MSCLISTCCRRRCWPKQDDVAVMTPKLPGENFINVDGAPQRNVSNLAQASLHLTLECVKIGEKNKEELRLKENDGWDKKVNKEAEKIKLEPIQSKHIGHLLDVVYLKSEADYPITARSYPFNILLKGLEHPVFKRCGVSAFIIDRTLTCYAATEGACKNLEYKDVELIGLDIQKLTKTRLFQFEVEQKPYYHFENIRILKKLLAKEKEQTENFTADLYLIPYEDFFVSVVHRCDPFGTDKDNKAEPFDINEYLKVLGLEPLNITKNKLCLPEHIGTFFDLVYYEPEYKHSLRGSFFKKQLFKMAKSEWKKKFFVVCDRSLNILAFNLKFISLIKAENGPCYNFNEILNQRITDLFSGKVKRVYAQSIGHHISEPSHSATPLGDDIKSSVVTTHTLGVVNKPSRIRSATKTRVIATQRLPRLNSAAGSGASSPQIAATKPPNRIQSASRTQTPLTLFEELKRKKRTQTLIAGVKQKVSASFEKGVNSDDKKAEINSPVISLQLSKFEMDSRYYLFIFSLPLKLPALTAAASAVATGAMYASPASSGTVETSPNLPPGKLLSSTMLPQTTLSPFSQEGPSGITDGVVINVSNGNREL